MTSPNASDETPSAPPEPYSIDLNLSRTPHLYHRQSISLTRNDVASLAGTIAAQENSSESSSERGTEADDEKGPILRGLPAPPLRARKGWKGSKSPIDLTPALTPFPSPPLSDHSQTYFSSRRKEKQQSRTSRSLEKSYIDAQTYDKYLIRRRAEVVRRCTETALIAIIGMAVCRKAIQDGTLRAWKSEVMAAGTTTLLLYATYPLQVIWYKLRSGHSLISASRHGFHVPSRFDPGPLLYPVLFPFFIAVSLIRLNEPSILVNLVLGMASIPSRLFTALPTQFSIVLHWTLCLTPLNRLHVQPQDLFAISPAGVEWTWAQSLNAEALTLLFPLHQTLLSIIKYLTTTSLDPTEIQLLSTGLINLLLFASAPQSRILQTILWPGVVCILVLCYKPLRWEVALARIPAWKFARNRSPKAGIMSRIEFALGFLLPVNNNRKRPQLDSDDEDYEHLRQARKHSRANGRLSLSQTTALQSSIEPLDVQHEALDTDKVMNGLTRSVTLPTPPQSRKLQRQPSLNLRTGLLSLTPNQAQAVRWIIAGYVYMAVLSIALLVLWPYIGRHALSSHEPIGWALGYLLGNIPQFRFWIVSNNLERWVALPPRRSESDDLSSSGWVEQYRQMTQGPANIRLLLIGYCLAILGAGLAAVYRLRSVVEVDTRRKIFHGIMVAMMLPIIPVDPCFVSLALVVILALFLLLDLFRASQLPPLSKPLTAFLAPYVDGRDYRGPVVISHIFLLIGCAIPLWLALAGTPRGGSGPWTGWEAEARDLSMISGVVCVGMGDAAASLIGRRYGRSKWFWGGGKSIEGSCAFIVAVTVGLMASYLWLRVGGWVEWDMRALPHATLQAVMAATGASLLESVLTAANDNVVVPVGLWLLVRGLEPGVTTYGGI